MLALKARGVAVLLNSHLIGEVERVCDRVVILDRGRVAASGTLAELLGQRELRLRLTASAPPPSGGWPRPGRLTRERRLVHRRAARRRRRPPPCRTWSRTWSRSASGCTPSSPAAISLEERLLGILRGRIGR